MATWKICKICEKEFLAAHANTAMCSDDCKKKSRRIVANKKNHKNPPPATREKNKPTKKICVMCQEEFETTSFMKKACSDECSDDLKSYTMRKHRGKDTRIKVKREGYIDPKFLVRGNISIGSTASSLSYQA